MAFQAGLIKLEGTIGDLSFYKTKNNGYQVRQKGGVDAKRIATDPNYERTRENNAEFGRASLAGKLLRHTFSGFIGKNRDGSLCSRLVRVMLLIIQLDADHDRGRRVVTHKETEILKSFEFNKNAPVRNLLLLRYSGVIDRDSGVCTVYIPTFVATSDIVAPVGTTHFRFKAGAAAMDFTQQQSGSVASDSVLLAYDSTVHQAMSLVCTLDPGRLTSLFLTFGINFYQKVNGTDYLLNNDTSSGFCVIAVDGD